MWMALYSLYCADVPLRIYSLTRVKCNELQWLLCLVHKILNTGHSPYLTELLQSYNITSPQGPRVHLPVTYFLFREYRDTTSLLVRALSARVAAPKIWNSIYLFTSANPKHTLPSDVILRRWRTTSFQPILLRSGPCNAPWFSSETWRYINLLLTYLGLLMWCQVPKCHSRRYFSVFVVRTMNTKQKCVRNDGGKLPASLSSPSPQCESLRSERLQLAGRGSASSDRTDLESTSWWWFGR